MFQTSILPVRRYWRILLYDRIQAMAPTTCHLAITLLEICVVKHPISIAFPMISLQEVTLPKPSTMGRHSFQQLIIITLR